MATFVNVKKRLVIAGEHISDIPSFYTEMNRVFMMNEDWEIGSLDALSDMFYGGYGEIKQNEPVELVWYNFEENKESLGLEATRAFYRHKISNPVGFNVKLIQERLQAVEDGTGQTFFEIVLEIIAQHSNIIIQPQISVSAKGLKATTKNVSIIIKTVDADSELMEIRKLQEENLKRNLRSEEAENEGFVTAEYTIEFLTKMHSFCPSIIAVADGKVVGYALVATKDIRSEHNLLGQFFDELDVLTFRDKSLKDCNYVLSGQLCVARGFRGQGLSSKMYKYFQQTYEHTFDYCVTDIAESNVPSVKAHIKVGFEEVVTVVYAEETWVIVVWDWSEKRGDETTAETPTMVVN